MVFYIPQRATLRLQLQPLGMQVAYLLFGLTEQPLVLRGSGRAARSPRRASPITVELPRNRS